MNKLNNGGFTLVEVLAVVVVIAVVGMVAVPNVLSIIGSGSAATYDILVEDIAIAGKQLYEEIENVGVELYHYDNDGNSGVIIELGKDKDGSDIGVNDIKINLQTLVSNGLLTSGNNDNKSGDNKNDKVIINPRSNEDIGECEIVITKIVDGNFNTSYQIDNVSTNDNCPSDSEYDDVLN